MASWPNSAWNLSYRSSTRSVTKKPCLERIRICGGWAEAPTTTYTVLFSEQGGSPSPCWFAPVEKRLGCWAGASRRRAVNPVASSASREMSEDAAGRDQPAGWDLARQ